MTIMKGFMFVRSGGGELSFKVEKCDDYYQVIVLSKGFKRLDKTLELKNPVLVSRLDKMFSGENTFNDKPKPKDVEPDDRQFSGTWTEIIVYFDDGNKDPNIKTAQVLNDPSLSFDLESLVRKNQSLK